MELSRDASRLVDRISTAGDMDILLVCGDVDETTATLLIEQCEEAECRANVLLILITHGGAPDWAYRMARYLQSRFQHFSIFIPDACKSAGTLVAIGAHEVIIGPFGEIGPLDVQFYKVDELDVVSSGLVAESAIKSLEKTAIEMFEKYLLRLHSGSGGLMTLKTATEMAADLVAKLLNPVYSQIDPFRIGENDLMMRVAKEYGERLAKRSGNLRSRQTLKMLVEHYPSHDFVIDCHEVETIFKKVRGPEARLRQLAQALGLPQMARSYDENSHIVAMLTGRPEAGVAAAIAPADMHEGATEQPRRFHKVTKRPRKPGIKGGPPPASTPDAGE
jgi:hypothetical protein